MSSVTDADNRYGTAWFIIGLAMVVALGHADYAGGRDLNFAPFYVVPIALATWGSGIGAGIALAAASAAAWLVAESLQRGELPISAYDFWNILIRGAAYVGIAILLARYRKTLRVERVRARTDYLTGAANAAHFSEMAVQALRRARRSRRPLSIAFVDVDDFKLINDQYGHAAGDRVLQASVAAMRRNVRRGDVVARVGGDEFVMLFPETDEDCAGVLIARIRQSLSEELEREGFQVSLSVGIATFAVPPRSVEEMVSAADRAMYTVKAATKDRLHPLTYPPQSIHVA
jgi:diguanylate cyclase (GGDEF)-like protein